MQNTVIVGLGGYGINMINFMKDKSFDQVTSIVIDNDEAALNRSQADKKIFSSKGSNELDELSSYENIILLSGLGGMFSTSISLPLIKQLKLKKKNVIGFFALPFPFEGVTRIANDALNHLKDLTDSYGAMDNNALRLYLKEKGTSLNLTGALSDFDQRFHDAIIEILSLDTFNKEAVDSIIKKHTTAFASPANV